MYLSLLKKIFTKEQTMIYGLLICSLSIFFLFGLYHLAKFETTDEHLWKYGRIKQYWQAIATHDWDKTYINDKPGVTVALISGIGLLTQPNPEDQFISSTDNTRIFEQYDSTKTQPVNFAFRLPILIFATLSLIIFFLLINKIYDDLILALFATALLAINPILLGMSQIINPDSFYWIFGGCASLAYIGLIEKRKRIYLFLCIIFTGGALLSKYTAFTLVVFYALYWFASHAFVSKDLSMEKNDFFHTIKNLITIAIIMIGAIGVFIIFLPASFTHPSYIFKGLSQFILAKNLPYIFFMGAIGFGSIYLFKMYYTPIMKFIHAKNKFFLYFAVIPFVLIFVINFFNTWTGQKLIPFDNLREASYANEPNAFNFKPYLKDVSKTEKKITIFFTNAYPFTFSLNIIMLGGSFVLIYWTCTRDIAIDRKRLVFSVTAFTVIYFVLTVFARVVTNVRYVIMLYPFIALLAAQALREFTLRFNTPFKKYPLLIVCFILIYGATIFWSIRPFYFSYANALLPQQFSIHDSWGHGSYEAAQYLNALPNAKDIIIFSNSDTVCRFFVGRCLRNRKIDLAIVTPDYFVITKRGEIKVRNRFILENNPYPKKDSDYYFKKLHSAPTWQLLINNRPDNYISIMQYEK